MRRGTLGTARRRLNIGASNSTRQSRSLISSSGRPTWPRTPPAAARQKFEPPLPGDYVGDQAMRRFAIRQVADMDGAHRNVACGRKARWIEIGQVNSARQHAEGEERHGAANALRGARQSPDTSVKPNIHRDAPCCQASTPIESRSCSHQP